jgi:hypothetical protein
VAARQDGTIISHRTSTPPTRYTSQRTPRPTVPCVALEVKFLQLVQTRDIALGVFLCLVRRADLTNVVLIPCGTVETETRRVRQTGYSEIFGRKIVIAASVGLR